MKRYLVSWEIDIYAESFEDAALQALGIQQDPESTATVFRVTLHREDSGEVDSKLLDINLINDELVVTELGHDS